MASNRIGVKKWFRHVKEEHGFKILIYVLMFVIAIVLRLIDSFYSKRVELYPTLWRTIIYKGISILSDSISIGAGASAIISLIKAWFTRRSKREAEEDQKTESNHHKIIRQYIAYDKQTKAFTVDNTNGKNTEHLVKEIDKDVSSDFFSKTGYIMQIHNTNTLKASRIKPKSKEQYSTDYLKEKASIEEFTKKNKDGKNIGRINIANVNIYTNIDEDFKLKVEDDNQKYELDEFITSNRMTLLGAHESKSNNVTIRLKDINYDEKRDLLTLYTQRTTYYDMLITNRAMDYDLGETTLRKTYEFNSVLTPLKDSKLSNQIGVTGIILSTDGYVLMEKRDLQKSTWRDKFGPTISCSMHEKDILKDDKLITGTLLQERVIERIKDSLKKNYGFIEYVDYDKLSFKNSFMGIARDLLEGGKPNMYFYVKLNCDAEEATKRMQKYASIGEVVENTNKRYRKIQDREKKAVLAYNKKYNNESIGSRSPIASDKLKGEYYFVDQKNISLDYYYQLRLKRNSAYAIGRNYSPRKKSLSNPLIVNMNNHSFTREVGEGLLVCLSYLEILISKNRIKFVNEECSEKDSKVISNFEGLGVASYGEVMVKHTVNKTDCKDLDTLVSKINAKEKIKSVDSYGGTEANVLCALSKMNVKTKYLSVFPENELGEKCFNNLNGYGVDCSKIIRLGNKMGEYYFLNNDELPRDTKTKFYRVGSAVNEIDINNIDFDYDEFFNGIGIFHLSGIALSLDDGINGNAYKSAIRLVKEAKKRGILVSFDFNFRPGMWEGKYQDKTDDKIVVKKMSIDGFKAIISDILKYVNIMLCSSKDLITFLDFKSYDTVFDIDGVSYKKEINDFRQAFFNQYKNCKYLVIRDRQKPTEVVNWVKSCIITKDDYVIREKQIFAVKEPIGAGDVFDAGILNGILKNNKLDDVLDFATKAFIYKHQIKGDILNIENDLSDIINELDSKIKETKILLAYDKKDSEFDTMEKNLSLYAEVETVVGNPSTLENVDIFIGKRLTPELLDTADKLKAVFAYKTGVDDFPIELLNQKSIDVYNSHVDAEIIAKYAFALATSLACRITESSYRMRSGVWSHEGKFSGKYWNSIEELKIGLLGFGHIGKEINKILQKNNIETYTIYRDGHDNNYYQNIHTLKDIDEMINECDMIISSLPKTKDTNLIFTKERLEKMHDVYLVNVGRSNIYNRKDLYEALKSEKIAGAAIDTWDSKPKSDGKYFPWNNDTPFEELPNIILSPHQAMKVEEGHKRYVDDTCENVIEYIYKKNTCYDVEEDMIRNKVNLKKGY